MDIKGSIHRIGATTSKQVGDKTYKERDIIIMTTEQYNGKDYHQYPKMTAKRDNLIGFIDSLKVGDEITAHFNLRGVMYTSKKDGTEQNFTTCEVYKIDKSQGNNDGIPVHSAAHTTNGGSGYVAPASTTVDDLPW